LRIHKYLAAPFVAVFAHWVPITVAAQTKSAIEQEKMHTVSRMYQATYGAQERCHPSKEASANLNLAIDQLRHAFPELLNLIDSSQYLPTVREQFMAYLNDPAAKSSNEELKQECSGIEYLLRQLVETPGGQQAANDMIQALKK
jgi:hypothetical protein